MEDKSKKNENMPVSLDGEDQVALVNEDLPANTAHALINADANTEVQGGPIVREYDAGQEYDGMRGGFASVKGKTIRRFDNKLVWIVLIVMTVMCFAVGICSSLLTAHFMRNGEQPPIINTEETQQNVAAVVAARKSSIAEVMCGGSRGSGIVMKREGNNVYVMTNAHILAQYVTMSRMPAVRFYGEDSFYQATVVGYVGYYDVAVLMLAHETRFTVYNLDGSEFFSPDSEYSEGEHIVSIGNAMSMGIASYDGIISRGSEILECSNLFNEGGKKYVPVLRSTAVINAGMSGGGVFDMDGKLVGMGTYRMSNSAGVDEEGAADADVEDTGFAVPVSVLYPVYKQILADANGGEASVFPLTIKKSDTSSIGWIGTPFGFNCEYRNGMLTVVTRDQNAPSDKINEQDVIKSIGGIDISDDICKAIGRLLSYSKRGMGDKLYFTVLRDGEELNVMFDEYRYAV